MKISIDDNMNSIAVENMTNEQFDTMLDAVKGLIAKEEAEESEDDF
jgi:hypothetical protein